MKDARYLIRMANVEAHKPVEQGLLLQKARTLAISIKGKAINLRVSPVAIEFDLFCSPQIDEQLIKIPFQSWGEIITCKRLDILPIKVEAQKIVDEARSLFNEHRFWEVHEVLEGLWKELQGPEKQLVQGLILAAAAFVHAQKDEESVAWPMLQEALKRLAEQPDLYYGWNIENFRNHFARILMEKKLTFLTV